MSPKNTPSRAPAVHSLDLLAHPEVVRALRGTLRRQGVASQDLNDAIAEAQLAALEATRAGRMPGGIAEWTALLAKIAGRRAIDRHRQMEVRDRSDAGLCDDADDHSALTLYCEQTDQVDLKRALAVLKDLLDSGEMPRDTGEILMAEMAGVPHAEIAAELGVNETVVNNRLARARATFRAKLAALGMLLLTVALLIVFALPMGEVTAPAPAPPPEPAPSARCMPGWDGGPCPPPDLSAPVRENRDLSD